MRKIGVITVGRSDYGIYLPVLRAMRERAEWQLELFAGGAHFAPEFGETWRAIAADGFEIQVRVDIRPDADTPAGVARAMGRMVAEFATQYERRRPDLLLALGDRYEMHAAVLAALPLAIPVAHIHGGELTEGAMDESLRHSITKLSHLHFAATPRYAERLVRMGEEPWRVTVSGAPALDNLRNMEWLAPPELERIIELPLKPAPLLATWHPVTLEPADQARQLDALLGALADVGRPVVFTAPNADAGGGRIREAIRQYIAAHADARFVENLGAAGYFSLMRYAAAMVGNSSSGIIEAPSLKLPVVNVGSRQRGRERAANVIDVESDRAAIAAAVLRALDPAFRSGLENLVNPYGDGRAAPRIVEVLARTPLDRRLLLKKFYDGKE
jgi:UDP-hydrolysing UDP-N-acetyl-D-glucosamine 2-epimerase